MSKFHLITFLTIFLAFFRILVVAQNTIMTPNMVTMPRLSYDALLAIPNPPQGSMTYDTTYNCLRVYNGSRWICTYQDPINTTPNIVAFDQIGGTNDVLVKDIALDQSGNIYITGQFSGTANFGNISITSLGGDDIFVAKYNKFGIPQWATRAGSVGNGDLGDALAVDASGNVYVTGNFEGVASFGNVILISFGGIDVFIAKYNTNGVIQWVKKGGSAANEYSHDIALDDTGAAYITGYFNGTVNFGTGNLTSAGSTDIFLAKYNSSGTNVWTQRAGGASHDRGYGLAIDSNNDLYVTGYFYTTATFGGTISKTSVGANDIFLAKYNSAGSIMWVERGGGTVDDSGDGLAIDSNNNVFLMGRFYENATLGTTTFNAEGGTDIFIAKYSTNGGYPLWVRTGGSYSDDYGGGIAVDNNGVVYATGYFIGTGKFGTSTFISNNISEDIFIVRYTNDGVFQGARQGGGPDFDTSYGIAPNNTGSVFVVGSFSGKATFGLSTLTATNLYYRDGFLLRMEQY